MRMEYFFLKDVIFHASAFIKDTFTISILIGRVPPIYEVLDTLKEMSLLSCTDAHHAKRLNYSSPVRENV